LRALFARGGSNFLPGKVEAIAVVLDQEEPVEDIDGVSQRRPL
jgi:hypothetical protein